MSQQSRWILALGLGAAMVASLSACSTTGGATTGDTTPSTSQESGTTQVSITWATTNSPTTLKAEEAIAAAFMAENPDIKVTVDAINFADYDTKLNTSLRAAKGPDVFRVNHPNVRAWADAGYLSDLKGSISANGVDMALFIPGLVEVGSLDGKQVTLPIDTDARAFWYNPKLLKKAGIVDAQGKAKAPETWAELVDSVAKFKGTDTYGYVFRTDSDYAMAYEAVGPYMKAAGGKILSSDAQPKAVAGDDPHTIAAVTLLQSIVKTGAVPPGEANMSEQTSYSLFAGGKVAMMTAGPWARDAIVKAAPGFKYGEDYALTVIPVPAAGDASATTSGGWQIGVNAKSEHAEAAGRFMAYFERAENLTKLASNNSFPPLIKGMEGEPFASDPFFDAFKELLPHSGLPITPVSQMAQVSAEFEVSARAAVNDGKDVTQELKAFDTRVNEQVLQ